MATDEGPPAHIVQAALRKTTEALAYEFAQPTGYSPQWSPFEWLVARAAAAIHGVSPLLSSNLHWEGPAGWAKFLHEQREHTRLRQRRFEELLSLIDGRAQREGLAIVALKGAALHAMGIYSAGERPMADLDLLVAAGDIAPATALLQDIGFREAWANWKHRVFMPERATNVGGLGEHRDTPIKIELHDRLGEILPHRIIDISSVVLSVDPSPGIAYYPGKSALMAHLLLHAAGAMAYRRVRLINLHDIALLSAQMTEGDWDEILNWPASVGDPWWAVPPLLLTARYYGLTLPERLVPALAPGVPRLLRLLSGHRDLSDVSLSYIWVDGFPGIEWAQSISEMAEYVAGRLRPDGGTLAMRNAMRSESWAVDDPWYRLSHGRRIARYATSRITRAASMYPVRTALAQSQ